MSKDNFIEMLESYAGISQMARTYSYREILDRAAGLLAAKPEDLETWPMGGYSKGRTSGAYQYVLEDIIKNIYHYDWVYARLYDKESRRVFTNLMQYRIVPDMSYIKKAYDGFHMQYFDPDIVVCDESEVFVDCGGYIGDTVENYLKQYNHYKKIYIYEPADSNVDICRKNLQNYKNLEIRKCGVGEECETLLLSGSGASGSFIDAGAEAGEYINVISLDEDIKEKVTYIKMDVEGFEIPAIIGAKKHIRNDIPKLAICTYHIISDIWEIPRLIYNIYDGYKFYIRHYMENQNWETVLYAIPDSGSDRMETE